MHRIINPWTTSLLLATLVLPATLAAQSHPNIAVGLSPESTYDSSGIDNVSLFSGALSIGPIPLGPRYPVSSTLSYGLNAVYNANIWRYVERENGVETMPSRRWNLGAGWLVTLGELYHPGYVFNETDDWLYVDPSGAAHKLYQQLHDGENDGDLDVLYSRDNSFVRMDDLDDSSFWRTIETPDGLIRTFVKRGSRFRLEKIEDRFSNNWVKIAYSEAGQLPAPPDPYDEQERITDSQGRTHRIYLQTDLHWVGPTIAKIDFEGPNGQRLYWTFGYHDVKRARSCKDTLPDNPDRIRIGFLVGINRPDGSKFEMLEPDGQAAYWDLCAGDMYDRPGMLRRITLPTGGSIRYDYQRYDFPGGEYPPDYYKSATGVATRKTYDRDGALIGTTTYHTTRDVTNKEMVTVVIQPTGECSRHFFEADPTPHTSTGEGWDYGLPYTDQFTVGGNRHLSSEIWTSHSGSSCAETKLRSTYVKFTHDRLPNLGGNPSNWYNTNRRLQVTRTAFHDLGGRYLETALIGWDGVGHFRQSHTTSDISFTNDRHVTTNFNSGRSPWTPWPVGDPWILGTFSSRRVEEPGAVGQTTARVDYEFNPDTGALACRRVLKSGNSRSGADIVTEYKRNGVGNVWQVRTRGGDGAGLPTGILCAGNGGAGANFTYAHGVLKTTRSIGTNGSLLGYFTYDADIDPGTGWVTATRDASGLATSYTYDALGRVEAVTPQEGASSSITYTHGSGTSAARIRTKVTSGGATLSDSIVTFDGLGRAIETQRRTPDHGWVSTSTKYDAAGRVLSQTLPNDPAKKVHYLQYDPFGRPGRIRPPEGSGHDVLLSYTGLYDYSRSVKVGEPGGKVYETWHYNYDGHGRLRIVTEPGAVVGQETGASLRAGYDYDVMGRLTKVRTVDGANDIDIEQRREFTYDNRGFLLEERHPELGPDSSATGHFAYSGYDVFGNPGRVVNSARDLRFTYDPFGRLTQVRDGLHGSRLVKEFSYDTANGSGEGKLHKAIRHNWVTPPGEGSQDVKVTETYGYWGTAGALSVRATEISRGGLEFVEDYFYDAAGQLTGQGYPICGHAGCDFTDLPSRRIDFTYSLGHLRTVGATPPNTPILSGPITYHPDGSWATIPHGNGVTDHRTIQTGQTGNPSRTARLYSTGASSNYNSGWFSYDGAGHIIQMGNQAYVYDEVGRLRGTGTKTGGTWDPPGPQIDWEWRYGYDAYGNLKQHTRDFPDGTQQTRTFAIDVRKNRVASASYDAAGNLLTWGGGTYGYDASGNLQYPNANLVYLYTASDERIGRLIEFQGSKIEEYTLRSAGGQLLRRVRRDDSMPAGDLEWKQDYVWRGGQLLATVNPTGAPREWHYTLNHLGSPVLVTYHDGTELGTWDYAPFGEDMSPAGNPPVSETFPLRFTGHERDFHGVGVLDDLDYMHARHYTPYVGRFLQVDPVLGSPGSPQSWNRYAYVGNDPVNFTDPSGLNPDGCGPWWPLCAGLGITVRPGRDNVPQGGIGIIGASSDEKTLWGKKWAGDFRDRFARLRFRFPRRDDGGNEEETGRGCEAKGNCPTDPETTESRSRCGNTWGQRWTYRMKTTNQAILGGPLRGLAYSLGFGTAFGTSTGQAGFIRLGWNTGSTAVRAWRAGLTFHTVADATATVIGAGAAGATVAAAEAATFGFLAFEIGGAIGGAVGATFSCLGPPG